MYEKVQRNPSFFILLDSKNYTDTKLFNHNFNSFKTELRGLEQRMNHIANHSRVAKFRQQEV